MRTSQTGHVRGITLLASKRSIQAQHPSAASKRTVRAVAPDNVQSLNLIVQPLERNRQLPSGR